MIFKVKEKQTLNPESICLTGFYVPRNGSYTLPSAHSVQYTFTLQLEFILLIARCFPFW